MAAVGSDLQDVLVGERELWLGGPPNELFRRLRAECPVHFTKRLTEFHPAMQFAGTPAFVESPFINQLKTLPFRLTP